jgi:hypothetical protein
MHRTWVSVLGVLLVSGAAFPAFAEHPGKGRGRPQEQSVEDHAEKAGKRVTKEAIDAVEDELTGTPPGGTSKGLPPGLAKKGKMPPGLEKQGKTPPGWEKGKKAGWDKEPKQESWVRRTVRGIFGRGKPQP